MAWIIAEGLDRSGKSTVAKLYQAKGYKIVHMSAPDNKYTKPGYTGPSYLDEIMDLYIKYTNQDVFFDRSPYGEYVWPLVYGRKAQLTDDDMEQLQEMENSNEVTRLLFTDSNAEAHWKRCVDNKEPLTRSQFNTAGVLFERMGERFGFEKKELTQYAGEIAAVGYIPQQKQQKDMQTVEDTVESIAVSPQAGIATVTPALAPKAVTQQQKLEKANAINEILSKRILKNKGSAYDELETEIRSFLDDKLASIFGNGINKTQFSQQELEILKLHCKQVIKKMEKL